MNRSQRRTQQSQNKQIASIRFHGKAYTVEEADLLAVKEQGLGHSEVALEIYTLIVAKFPDYAEAWNTKSLILHHMQRYEEALEDCEAAIRLKPDYAEAYNSQGIVLQEMKRYDEALASFDMAIALKPDYTEIHLNRGATLLELKRYNEALASYDAAVALNPESAEACFGQGCAFAKITRHEEAVAAFDKAITLKADYVVAYNNRGIALQEIKRYGEAAESFNRAIAIRPDYAEAYQNLGLVLGNLGKLQEAERMFRKALELNPGFALPLYNLSNIRTYHAPDHDDVEKIRALLNRPDIGAEDKECLNFALGKIYDDCGLYDEAFACFREANGIRSTFVTYDAGKNEAMTRNTMETFSKAFLAQAFPFASQDASPVFIVGMPRSGTTLMASMLSSHPAVASAGELSTLQELSLQLSGYPEAAKHTSAEVAQKMAQAYLKRLRRDDAHAPYVIDKHPLNFRHLGLIAMLFPKAHIIHCTRHKLDTALSNYFQRFGLYYDYSFDFGNIVHFQQQYEMLMKHWQSALPEGMMLEVSYEDMIANTEQMARRALDFLGLAWNERCVSPHANTAPVETASQWQVRQPIYTHSVGRWKHYEKYLEALREMVKA